MKFSIKDLFSKCDQIRRNLGDLVTFTEEVFNGKLHFLCSVQKYWKQGPKIKSKNDFCAF